MDGPIPHLYYGAGDSEQLSAHRLKAFTLAPLALDKPLRAQMFDLFARHHRDVDRPHFDTDLAAKDTVILLRAGNRVAGFTTLAFSTIDVAARRVAVVFSGDTIVDPACCGEQGPRAGVAGTNRPLCRASAGERYLLVLDC